MTQALSQELEEQYNFRARRPDYATAVEPDWVRRSEEFRQYAEGVLNLKYGSRARECLDFFPSGRPNSPILVYFHGGYWQRGDKSLYSFVAEPFLEQGIHVALVSYDLCPTVRLSHITQQARCAVAWIHDHAAELGGSRDQLFVTGHSAGGHITARLMGTDWGRIAPTLPPDLIKGGIPISGLFDLRPLMSTTINANLGLDTAEAHTESPLLHPMPSHAPQLVVCGGAETEHLRRQTDDYVCRFSSATRAMERYDVPGCDHFDVVNALADANSELFRKVVALVKG